MVRFNHSRLTFASRGALRLIVDGGLSALLLFGAWVRTRDGGRYPERCPRHVACE